MADDKEAQKRENVVGGPSQTFQPAKTPTQQGEETEKVKNQVVENQTVESQTVKKDDKPDKDKDKPNKEDKPDKDDPVVDNQTNTPPYPMQRTPSQGATPVEARPNESTGPFVPKDSSVNSVQTQETGFSGMGDKDKELQQKATDRKERTGPVTSPTPSPLSPTGRDAQHPPVPTAPTPNLELTKEQKEEQGHVQRRIQEKKKAIEERKQQRKDLLVKLQDVLFQFNGQESNIPVNHGYWDLKNQYQGIADEKEDVEFLKVHEHA